MLNPGFQEQLKLPLEFMSYGISFAKMYYQFGKKDTFIIANDDIPNKLWGNSVVYGAIFLLKDFDFYSRVLDGYHLCSQAVLGRNHVRDVQHRRITEIKPIFFNSIDELARLKYKESDEPIEAQCYFGNLQHPKILRRIMASVKYQHRILDGVDPQNFKELFRRNVNG